MSVSRGDEMYDALKKAYDASASLTYREGWLDALDQAACYLDALDRGSGLCPNYADPDCLRTVPPRNGDRGRRPKYCSEKCAMRIQSRRAYARRQLLHWQEAMASD